MRVVVAEDHALLRDGLTRLLAAYDCEVVEALAGTDGLAEALQRPDVDVAILDVRLPPTFSDEGLRAAIAASVAAERGASEKNARATAPSVTY